MHICIPSIHINGTSKDVLIDQLCSAILAINEAESVLQKACPNARDYYTQSKDAAQEALRQHANRLHALRAVCNELQEIAESI